MSNSRVVFYITFIYVLGLVQSYSTSSTGDFQVPDATKITFLSDEESSSESESSEAPVISTPYPKYPWSHVFHHTQTVAHDRTTEKTEAQIDSSANFAHFDDKLIADTSYKSYDGAQTSTSVADSSKSTDETGITGSSPYPQKTSPTSQSERISTHISSDADLQRAHNNKIVSNFSSIFNLNISFTTETSVATTLEDIKMSSEASSEIDQKSFISSSTTDVFHSTPTSAQPFYLDHHDFQATFGGDDSEVESSRVSIIDVVKTVTEKYILPTIVSSEQPRISATETTSSDSETSSADTDLVPTDDITQVPREFIPELFTISSPMRYHTDNGNHSVVWDKNESTQSSDVTYGEFDSTTLKFSTESYTPTNTSQKYSYSSEEVSTEDWFNPVNDGNKNFSKYEILNKTRVPDFVARVSSTEGYAVVTEEEDSRTSPKTLVDSTSEVTHVKVQQHFTHEDVTLQTPRENDDIVSTSVETTTRMLDFSVVSSTTENFAITTEQAEHHTNVTVPVVAGVVAILALATLSIVIWLRGRRKRNNMRLRLRDRLESSTKRKTPNAADLPRFMVAMRQFPDHEVL